MSAADARTPRGHNLLAGVLLGVGLAALVDEIVFHRLLGWRHLYAAGSADVVTGALFLAVGLLAGGVALFLHLDLHRQRALRPRLCWASGLISAGAFQLWSGLLQYGLPPVGESPHALPLALASLGLVAAGALLLLHRPRPAARRTVRPPAEPERHRPQHVA